MATTYTAAGAGIDALVEKVMAQNHPDLKERHVTVVTLMAARETKRAGSIPALKVRGLPVLAIISITSLADRARGIADAKLVIDDYSWFRLSDVRRTAAIDHELEHLELVKTRATKRNGYTSRVKIDDRGRPCLRIRPHDWELTGFAKVVERHGEASIEAAQFLEFRAEFGQLNLFGPNVLDVVAPPVDDHEALIDARTKPEAVKPKGAARGKAKKK